MMTDSTGNEVVAVGIGAWDQEFGHAPAHGRTLDMLAQRPPAEVVDIVEILIRTVEKGNILGHPVGCILVGNVGHRCFPLFGVEGIECLFVSGKPVGIGRKDVGGKHGGLHLRGSACIQTVILVHKQTAAMTGHHGSITAMEGEYAVGHRSADHIGNMIADRRVEFIGTRHVEILISGRLVVRFREDFSRAEDDARDGFHRRIKLPFADFLAIHEIDGAVLTCGKQGLDVVFHPHLIFFHKGAIAGAALHSDGPC